MSRPSVRRLQKAEAAAEAERMAIADLRRRSHADGGMSFKVTDVVVPRLRLEPGLLVVVSVCSDFGARHRFGRCVRVGFPLTCGGFLALGRRRVTFVPPALDNVLGPVPDASKCSARILGFR